MRIRSILTIAVLAALTAPSAAAAAPATAVPRCDRARGRSRSSTRRRVSTSACSSAERAAIAEGAVDLAGSLLFRGIEPGNYTVEIEDAGAVATTDVAVPGFDDPPPQAFYDDQQIGPGFGYVTVRDGTTLSVNVVLPGDIDDGPFPTVVEYSGYDPSDPAGSGVGLSALMTALGYASVGVNMRGSGCSGGSFDYFEPIQATDGYDVIETVAAQPWVESGNASGWSASRTPASASSTSPRRSRRASPRSRRSRRRLVGTCTRSIPAASSTTASRLEWAQERDGRDGAVRPGVDAGGPHRR